MDPKPQTEPVATACWRHLDLGVLPAIDCLALPEAMARGVAGGGPDTLALYLPGETFVSIGAEQETGQAANVELCEARGVPILRRASGGGALYVDSQQVFSTVACRPPGPIPANLDQLYNDWLQPLQRTCRQYHIPAQYQQYNRLQLGRYQIASATASLVDGVLLFTANILLNVSQETVNELLGIPADGDRGRPLTSLRHEFEGHDPPHDVELRDAIARQFEGLKAVTLERGEFTDGERQALDEGRRRLAGEDWLHGVDRRADRLRNQSPEEGGRVVRNQRRTDGGLLDLTLVSEASCVRDVQFTGSPLFLQPDGLRQVENYLRGCYLSPVEVGERVVNLYQTVGLQSAGTTPADFLILIADVIG